jgi:predicted dehydrogenase
MAPKRIGFAVVGLGGIAEDAVLPAFRHSKKTKLIALVSGDEKKARRFAARFGARDYYTYEDYALCLNHPQVQAVFIANHNGGHADYTIRAAAAGRHVLCEKPMANTVDECQRMVAACRANDVRLMIAYRKYFEPASLALKKLITSGKLGRLKILHSAFTIFLPPSGVPAWHFDRKLAGGGSLVDVGVYCVNTVRWLLGREPVEASAYAWTHDPARYREVEENISFQLKFPEGIVLQASSSFGAAKGSFLHVHGERGWAALDPAYPYNERRRLFGEINGRWFEKEFRPIDEFALELDAFADAVRRGRDPEPDGLEGLRDVAVMEAIYRSARENRPVTIHVRPAPGNWSPAPGTRTQARGEGPPWDCYSPG